MALHVAVHVYIHVHIDLEFDDDDGSVVVELVAAGHDSLGNSPVSSTACTSVRQTSGRYIRAEDYPGFDALEAYSGLAEWAPRVENWMLFAHYYGADRHKINPLQEGQNSYRVRALDTAAGHHTEPSVWIKGFHSQQVAEIAGMVVQAEYLSE